MLLKPLPYTQTKDMESKFESLWIGTTPTTNYPQLTSSLKVDVAIIGGGIAGLTAAYFLTREGRSVAVIEAERIITGTTGYTTAKVTSLHGLKYDFLKTHFGKEGAKIYADSNQWAIETLEQITREEKIPCDFSSATTYTYTETKEKLEEIKKEVSVAKELKLPASFVSSIDELPFPVNGAIKLTNQAYFHPRKFLLALTELITKSGCHIFEKSRVTDIKENDLCDVVTEKATLRAENVIIATNYPIYDKALFFLRMPQIRSYALALQVQGKIPDGMYLGTDQQEHSIRPHRSGKHEWLIVGGEDHSTGEEENTRERYNKLEQFSRERFEVKSIDYQWSAQDCMPIDNVPFIGRMPFTKCIFVTTGFGEWGMTTSFVSAQILTDSICKRENPWSELYKPSRFKPMASAKEALAMGKHVIKGFSSYVTKNDSKDFANMKPGSGRIVTYKGKKLAVHKDLQGKLHVVSAACTHMGCIVGWNNAEESWDCPCHGSRFSKNGKVLHGPATKGLPKERLQ